MSNPGKIVYPPDGSACSGVLGIRCHGGPNGSPTKWAHVLHTPKGPCGLCTRCALDELANREVRRKKGLAA